MPKSNAQSSSMQTRQRPPDTLIKSSSTSSVSHGRSSPHPPTHPAQPSPHPQLSTTGAERSSDAVKDAGKTPKMPPTRGFGATAGRRPQGVRAPLQESIEKVRHYNTSSAVQYDKRLEEGVLGPIGHSDERKEASDNRPASANERSVQNPGGQSPYFQRGPVIQQQRIRPFTPQKVVQSTISKACPPREAPQQTAHHTAESTLPVKQPGATTLPSKITRFPQPRHQAGEDDTYMEDQCRISQEQNGPQAKTHYQNHESEQGTFEDHCSKEHQRLTPQLYPPPQEQTRDLVAFQPSRTGFQYTEKRTGLLQHQPQRTTNLRYSLAQEPSSDHFQADDTGKEDQYDPSYVETFGEPDIGDESLLRDSLDDHNASSFQRVVAPEPKFNRPHAFVEEARMENESPLMPPHAPPFSFRPEFVNSKALVEHIDFGKIHQTVMASVACFSDKMDWEYCRDMFKAQKEANEALIDRYSQYQKEFQALLRVTDETIEQKRQSTERYRLAGNDLNDQARELQRTARQIGGKRRRMESDSRESSFAA